MALACLIRHAQPNYKKIAFIVDHGLRPESSTEALTVKRYIENNIGSCSMVFRWEKM
jgi:tRNA(Ile)-lysidine synthase TilS/MesJ